MSDGRPAPSSTHSIFEGANATDRVKRLDKLFRDEARRERRELAEINHGLRFLAHPIRPWIPPIVIEPDLPREDLRTRLMMLPGSIVDPKAPYLLNFKGDA